MFKWVLVAILLLLAAWVAWEVIAFPNVPDLAKYPPVTTAFMELRKKELRREGKDPSISYQFVPYDSISPYLRRAVLVAEDDQFFEHGGVDTEAMKEAFKRDWERKKITHGGSTITQQLAKNLYLSPSRNPIRKLKEYFIAQSLEKHLTKKQILELYLNVVEYGERVYGAEAASRAYFKKSASALTPSQAALLAGCLPNPRVMTPAQPNARLKWRQRMILSRMRRWGYLAEREVLTAKKPRAAKQPEPPAVTTQTLPETDTAPQSTDTTATDLPPGPEPADDAPPVVATDTATTAPPQ